MNFIIYEDNKDFCSLYKDIIFEIMSSYKIDYHIHIISEYKTNIMDDISLIEGSKIFILDVEVNGKNGLDFAKEIRDSKDYISPIIVVTMHEEYCLVGYLKKILMLDFISKKKCLRENLINTLELALNIVNCCPSLNFTYKNESYQIPYDDIYYIEKKLNDNNSIIVTLNDSYEIPKSINILSKELPSNMFYKSHRSCLVNVNNIVSIDYDDGIISFGEINTNLLSRSNRKGLKERMT